MPSRNRRCAARASPLRTAIELPRAQSIVASAHGPSGTANCPRLAMGVQAAASRRPAASTVVSVRRIVTVLPVVTSLLEVTALLVVTVRR